MAFKINNETKIGAFTLITLTALILGYNFMKGKDFFSRDTVFFVKYDDLSGLAVSNQVKLKGLTVGKVMDLGRDEKSGMNVVKIVVDASVKVPKNSVAKITGAGLLDSKEIDLLLSKETAFHQSGDTLRSDIGKDLKAEVSAEFLPIKEKAEQLMSSIDSTITIVRSVFNDQMRDNLQMSVNSIRGTLKNLEQTVSTFNTMIQANTPQLNKIFTNIESVSSNLRNNNDKITQMIANLNALSDTLQVAHIAETINNAKKILDQLNLTLQKIQSGQGSLGALVNDDKLYKDLDHATRSMDSLFNSIKEDGVRIRLGGKKN